MSKHKSAKNVPALVPGSTKAIPPQSIRLRNFAGEVLFILISVLLIKNCIAGPYTIPTGSMEKTLLVGDYLFVNQFLYGVKTPPNIPFTDIHLPRVTLFPALRDPKRGDIVVFAYPGNRDQLQSDDSRYLIKRCVGTPGDVVEVRDKGLYVNGEKFPVYPGMQFINPSTYPKGLALSAMFPRGIHQNPDNYGPLQIPKKGDTVTLTAQDFPQWSIFIQREGHTTDLRNNIAYVDDKPVTKYIVQRNYYFMMGDNRDNSEDSRFWGFVPDDDIVGQPMFLYWSWDPEIPVSDIFQKIASVRWNRIGKFPE